jgi:HrpA-like RNA helicase
MAEFPLDPMLSKALLAAETYKVSLQEWQCIRSTSHHPCMAEFPLDPMLSKALLAAETYKVS